MMECGRCGKVAGMLIAGVGDCCWTPEDEARVYPGRKERRAAFDAACAELERPHGFKRCAELEKKWNIACPIHGDSSEEE